MAHLAPHVAWPDRSASSRNLLPLGRICRLLRLQICTCRRQRRSMLLNARLSCRFLGCVPLAPFPGLTFCCSLRLLYSPFVVGILGKFVHSIFFNLPPNRAPSHVPGGLASAAVRAQIVYYLHSGSSCAHAIFSIPEIDHICSSAVHRSSATNCASQRSRGSKNSVLTDRILTASSKALKSTYEHLRALTYTQNTLHI